FVHRRSARRDEKPDPCRNRLTAEKHGRNCARTSNAGSRDRWRGQYHRAGDSGALSGAGGHVSRTAVPAAFLMRDTLLNKKLTQTLRFSNLFPLAFPARKPPPFMRGVYAQG